MDQANSTPSRRKNRKSSNSTEQSDQFSNNTSSPRESPTHDDETSTGANNLQEDLLARLLFVSDEEAIGFSDEALMFIWSEAFPSDPIPQERSAIIEQLRKKYPAGNLNRNDALFRVLKRKRKLENYMNEKLDCFVEDSIAEKEIRKEDLEEETFMILANSNQNANSLLVTNNQTLSLHIDFNFPKVKKIKKTAMSEACKEVGEELLVQTKKWLSCEEVMQEVKSLKEKVKTLEEKVETLEPLKEKVKTLEGKVKTLEQESNETMAIFILKNIAPKLKMQNFFINAKEYDEAFKYNAKLLAVGRKNLTPSDFKLFKEFKEHFPYDVNFTNVFGEKKLQPAQELNDTEYVQWLCSLFKSLDENQTSQN